METSRRDMFTNRSLILLVLPIMGESLLGQLVGIIDGIMVSSVGEVAMSAVSLVTNLSGVMLNLLTALATGGTIVTSQKIGAQDLKTAKRSAGQVYTMSTMVSVIIAALCLVSNRSLLKLVFGNVEVAVLNDAQTYFYFDAASYPFMAMCAAGGAILRAQGKTKSILYVSILRNAINISGNAFCLYVLKLGVASVAIPTAVSRIVGAVLLFLLVRSKKRTIRPAIKDIFHINTRLMREMLGIGLPSAVENSMFQLGRLMTMSMISGFGTVQIAANAAAGALTAFVATFSAATRTASMNVIGQCVGAQDERQIRLNFKRLLVMTYVSHAIASVIMLIFRRFFVGLYVGLSDEAVELACVLVAMHAIAGIVLYTPSFFVAAPLRAANDSAYPMFVSLSSMALFRLTLAYFLGVRMGLGVKGVWLAMITDWVCRSICFTARWRSGVWKKKCGLQREKTKLPS